MTFVHQSSKTLWDAGIPICTAPTAAGPDRDLLVRGVEDLTHDNMNIVVKTKRTDSL